MESINSQRGFDRSSESDHNVSFIRLTTHANWFMSCVPRATDIRHGLDTKNGFSKVVHARAYRKYSQETLRVAKVLFLSLVNIPQRLIGACRRLLTEPGTQNSSQHMLMNHTISKSSESSERPRRYTGPSSATRTLSQPLSRSRTGKKLSGQWHAARLGLTSSHPQISQK